MESPSVEHHRSGVAWSEGAKTRAFIAAIPTTDDAFPVSGIREMIQGCANSLIVDDNYFWGHRATQSGRCTLRRAGIQVRCDRNSRDRNRTKAEHELGSVLLLQILNNCRQNDMEVGIPSRANVRIGVELLHDVNVNLP